VWRWWGARRGPGVSRAPRALSLVPRKALFTFASVLLTSGIWQGVEGPLKHIRVYERNPEEWNSGNFLQAPQDEPAGYGPSGAPGLLSVCLPLLPLDPPNCLPACACSRLTTFVSWMTHTEGFREKGGGATETYASLSESERGSASVEGWIALFGHRGP